MKILQTRKLGDREKNGYTVINAHHVERVEKPQPDLCCHILTHVGSDWHELILNIP